MDLELYTHDREILIYAFRYALGRCTYASQTMSYVIRKNWAQLSEHDKQLFKREIEQAIEQDMAGMDCDVAEWKKVLEMGE